MGECTAHNPECALFIMKFAVPLAALALSFLVACASAETGDYTQQSWEEDDRRGRLHFVETLDDQHQSMEALRGVHAQMLRSAGLQDVQEAPGETPVTTSSHSISSSTTKVTTGKITGGMSMSGGAAGIAKFWSSSGKDEKECATFAMQLLDTAWRVVMSWNASFKASIAAIESSNTGCSTGSAEISRKCHSVMQAKCVDVYAECRERHGACTKKLSMIEAKMEALLSEKITMRDIGFSLDTASFTRFPAGTKDRCSGKFAGMAAEYCQEGARWDSLFEFEKKWRALYEQRILIIKECRRYDEQCPEKPEP